MAIIDFETEETYKDLFDNANDLIHISELDGTLIYVNNSWMRVLGYSQDEIQGKAIYSFLVEEDRERFIRYRNVAIAGAEVSPLIISTKNKNGKVVHLEGFVSVKIRNGEPLYTRGIFRDITTKIDNEQKLQLSAQALLEREQNLQQLLKNAPDAVIVINREARITFWNPKAEEIFGWNSCEVDGATLSEKIIPLKYRQAHENGLKRYLQTGVAHVLNKTIEITALHKTGREFFVALTISTSQQNGEIVFIAFLRDISQQKAYEFQLAKRTKELEDSNKELENFAHIASHDMKEPIRKLALFCGLLETEYSQLLPQKGKLYLNKMKTSAQRLGDLVQGVLTFSTIDGNKDPLEIIDLRTILGSIQDDLDLLIEEKHARIVAGLLPNFEGIPFLIYQLFYNLIYNALKFSKQDVSPLIEISGRVIKGSEIAAAGMEFASVDFVEFIVKDNGIGFSPDHELKIFDTFSRLHTREQYEGTGLGLALCRNIVQKHMGFISAIGKEGEGATFIIDLPVLKGVDLRIF